MIDRNTLLHEAGSAALRVIPPTGVTLATAVGALNPQWIIAVPTAAYAIGQLAYLIWKWKREARNK